MPPFYRHSGQPARALTFEQKVARLFPESGGGLEVRDDQTGFHGRVKIVVHGLSRRRQEAAPRIIGAVLFGRSGSSQFDRLAVGQYTRLSRPNQYHRGYRIGGAIYNTQTKQWEEAVDVYNVSALWNTSPLHEIDTELGIALGSGAANTETDSTACKFLAEAVEDDRHKLDFVHPILNKAARIIIARTMPTA